MIAHFHVPDVRYTHTTQAVLRAHVDHALVLGAGGHGALHHRFERIPPHGLKKIIERGHQITAYRVPRHVGNEYQHDDGVHISQTARRVHAVHVLQFDIHEHYVRVHGVVGKKSLRGCVYLGRKRIARGLAVLPEIGEQLVRRRFFVLHYRYVYHLFPPFSARRESMS